MPFLTLGQTPSSAPEWAVYVLVIAFLMNILFVIAVLKWKRWGVYGLGAGFGLIFLMDLLIDPSIIIALRDFVVIVLLMVLLRPVWNYLE